MKTPGWGQTRTSLLAAVVRREGGGGRMGAEEVLEGVDGGGNLKGELGFEGQGRFGRQRWEAEGCIADIDEATWVGADRGLFVSSNGKG